MEEKEIKIGDVVYHNEGLTGFTSMAKVLDIMDNKAKIEYYDGHKDGTIEDVKIETLFLTRDALQNAMQPSYIMSFPNIGSSGFYNDPFKRCSEK